MAGPYARSPEKASPVSSGVPLTRDTSGSPARGGSKRAPRSAPASNSGERARDVTRATQLSSPVKGVYHEALAEGFLGKYGPVDDASIAAADKHATELKRRYARARTEEERTRVLNLASEATLRANMMRAERDFLQRQGLEVRGASQAAASDRAVRISLAGSPGKNAAAVRIQRIERGRRARARVESMRTERDANRDDARASFDDEAAERYSRARARVGKLRAEERVGAAKARVARHKAEERTRRWAEPEPAYDSPYLHSRETTPVKSRPTSASSVQGGIWLQGLPDAVPD